MFGDVERLKVCRVGKMIDARFSPPWKGIYRFSGHLEPLRLNAVLDEPEPDATALSRASSSFLLVGGARRPSSVVNLVDMSTSSPLDSAS